MEQHLLQPKKELHRLNIIIIQDTDFNYYAIHYKDEKLFRHLLVENYRSINKMFGDYSIDNPIKYINSLPTSDISKREIDNYVMRKVIHTISKESKDLSIIASVEAINAKVVPIDELTHTIILQDKNGEYYRIDSSDESTFVELNSDKNLLKLFNEKFQSYKINNIVEISEIREINEKLRSREKTIEIYRKHLMKTMKEDEFEKFCIKNNL